MGFMCSSDGHHTLYGKNPVNIFSGTKRSMALDLVCSIGDVGPSSFAQMMNLG